MVTKTEQLREFWNKGNIKKALSIFKTFKIGISKEDKRTVEIAYETLTGKGNFYTSIGIDTEAKCNEANQIVSLYLTKN